jgi:hypothetical protein
MLGYGAGDASLPHTTKGTLLLHNATYATDGDLVARNANEGGTVRPQVSPCV